MLNDHVMEGLRNAHHAEPPKGAKERVWSRLQEARAQGARSRRWMAGLAAGGLAVAAALVALRPSQPGPGRARLVQQFGSVAMVAGEHRVPGIAHAEMDENAWVETADGQVLAGVERDYLVWAVEDSRFRIAQDGRDVVVHLERGQVHVWSAPRSSGKLWVNTPRHRGAVIGTVFSVEYSDGGERFAVARGNVDVYDSQIRIAHLSAGEIWASGLDAVEVSPHVVSLLDRAAGGQSVRLQQPGRVAAEPAPAAASTPLVPSAATALLGQTGDLPDAIPVGRRRVSTGRGAPVPRAATATARTEEPARTAQVPPESEADRLAREAEAYERSGQFKAAADRYEALSRGSGIDAEWALYRLGKLRERHLADREGALNAWREHRRRFPSGSLRQEAHLSIVETLVRLGRNQEALGEAERFLAQYPMSERRDELARIKERLQP